MDEGPSVDEVAMHKESEERLEINYTTTIQQRGIFKNNSKDVNIAILAFTILDFFMSLPKNRQDDPLSKSKKFILSKQNIAVIVQLLMIENTNLVRCILKFIYIHFKSAIALEAIKDSGIVEFLILLLDNKELTLFEEMVSVEEGHKDALV